MIIVKVKPPLDEEDAGDLAFLVVDADAFSIQPDGGEVVFRRGGRVALRVPEGEYLGHWGPNNALE